jgi:hypothetical protein
MKGKLNHKTMVAREASYLVGMAGRASTPSNRVNPDTTSELQPGQLKQAPYRWVWVAIGAKGGGGGARGESTVRESMGPLCFRATNWEASCIRCAPHPALSRFLEVEARRFGLLT